MEQAEIGRPALGQAARVDRPAAPPAARSAARSPAPGPARRCAPAPASRRAGWQARRPRAWPGQTAGACRRRRAAGGRRRSRRSCHRPVRPPPPAGPLPCAAAATAWHRCGSRRSPSRSGRNRAARCRRSPRARRPSPGGSAPAPRRWRRGRNAPPRRSAPPAGCRGRPGSPRRRPGCRASPAVVASSPSVAAPPARERRVLGMLHDACAEAARVGQREAHQPRGADGAAAVGERDGARLASRPSSASSSPRQPAVTAP